MKEKYTPKQVLKFILPSLLGVFFFLYPIYQNGSLTTPLGIICNGVTNLIAPIAEYLVLIFVLISAVGALVTNLLKPKCILDRPWLSKFFLCSPIYLIFRVFGAVCTVLVVFQVGPELIISPSTGGTMIGLACTIMAWFLSAAFLIPLLTDYGVMDFVGTLISGVTKALFRLPGRSAVDLLASWIGSNNVGLVLTLDQYERGYYTKREALFIASCFSAVSLPFCLVVSAMIGVDNLFLKMYATLSITGVVVAIIMCRVPPLSKQSNAYYAPVGCQVSEDIPEGCTKLQWAFHSAIQKAETGPSVGTILKRGLNTFFSIILCSAPILMAFGTLATILANYTPVFDYISMPMKWYLSLLQVPEASAAASATIIGFIDMFLPAVLAAGIASVKTRFIICVLSLVQIIYMTEVGVLILTSKLEVKVWELPVIFLERTVIALPVIVLLTNLFGIS